VLAELAGTALLAPDREDKVQEWRHTLLVKIARFRSLQKIYMAGAVETINDAEVGRDSDEPPPKPESITLWMPSEMLTGDRGRGCISGLVDMEVKLRVAQCQNSLVTLCSRLHAKRFLIAYRNRNVTGQVRSTKAAVLIQQLGERVEAVAKRYRRGRDALVALGVAEEYPHLRELGADDLRLDGDAGETDAATRKKLTMIGAGRGARAPRNAPGTSKCVMSWIWTAPGAFDNEEGRLHDCESNCWKRRLGLTGLDPSNPGGMVPRPCPQGQMVRGGYALAGGDAEGIAVFGVAGSLVAGACTAEVRCQPEHYSGH
jgi:hypothetical protein